MVTMINPGLFSSATGEWDTSQYLYDILNMTFEFKLDPCCTPENQKCAVGFTKEEDGLTQDWASFKSVFVNPPYGREIGKWVEKAYYESRKGLLGCTVVCLLPARTDTRWFHDYCMRAHEIWFIKGRVRFGNSANSAPFPSMMFLIL